MGNPEWVRFDPMQMYPDYLEDLLEEAEPLIDLLKTALDIMADVVEIVGALVQGFVDAQQALIALVQAAIDSIIQQLTQTGFYWLFHMPKSRSGTLSLSQWTSNVAYSLDDYADTKRPILVDPNAFVGCIAIVAVASDYKSLLSDFRQMFTLFAKRIADATQIDRWPDREDPWRVDVGVGREPNWGSKRLADIIPPLMDIAKELKKFRDSISATLSGGEIYEAFAQILRDKAALLNAFASYILELLSLLENMLNWEGAYALPIYGQGDADWVKNILLYSRGGPWDVEDVKFTAGAVFLATGGTSAQVDLLFDLFGLPKVVTEATDEWLESVEEDFGDESV